MRKKWMPDDDLRQMAGVLTLQEIAEAQHRWAGGRPSDWLPTRPAVSRKLKSLRLPPRHGTRTDLIPAEWGVLSRDHNSPFRHMLEAVSRYREHPDQVLSDTDQRHITRLYDLLQGHRGKRFVVGYCKHHGFYLTYARPKIDTDIIREPTSGDECH